MTETRIRQFKIILLGDTCVGKTALLNRYVDDSFIPDADITNGIDFRIRKVEIEPGVRVKLYIWDTCGVQRYRTIVSSYIRGIHGCLLVFDLSNCESFKRIEHDLTLVSEIEPRAPCVLVGSKSDHKHRCVSREEAEVLAKTLGVPYVEASSLTGHNVKEAFETLVQMIYRNIPNAKHERFAVESRFEPQKEEPGASWSCLLM
uniref:Uncharacterized protein n=1 Tax=Neogobius melanostomus TaxID=47308 RepID=A0A8C6WQM1_9GOBI